MKFKDFLQSHGQAAPTRSVSLRLAARTPDGTRRIVDARAALVFINEQERAAALREARQHLRKEYNGDGFSEAEVQTEFVYRVLFRALRDEGADNADAPFFADIIECKTAMQRRVAEDTWDKYVAFLAEEFPEDIDQADFDALVKDAKASPLSQLLSVHGFSKIYRALPSLAATIGSGT